MGFTLGSHTHCENVPDPQLSCSDHVCSVWTSPPSVSVWTWAEGVSPSVSTSSSVQTHTPVGCGSLAGWLLCNRWICFFPGLTADRSDGASRTKSPPSRLSTDTVGELLQHRPGPQLHLLYNSVNFDPLYSVWRKMRLSLFFAFALIPVIQHADVRPLRLLLYLWKISFRSNSQSFGYWSERL